MTQISRIILNSEPHVLRLNGTYCCLKLVAGNFFDAVFLPYDDRSVGLSGLLDNLFYGLPKGCIRFG